MKVEDAIFLVLSSDSTIWGATALILFMFEHTFKVIGIVTWAF